MKNVRIFAISVLALSACNQQVAAPVDSESPSPVVTTTSSSSSEVATSSSLSSTATTFSAATTSSATTSSAATTSSSPAQARVIEMTVQNFAFVPSTINVKKGEKLTIRVRGDSGIHSFGSPDLGLNVRVEEGQTVDIVIPTDTVGSFSFLCMIPCGPGHRDMVGTIIVS